MAVQLDLMRICYTPLPCVCVCAVCRWYVPPSAGPPADGASTQLWVYRSSHEDKRDTQAGLAGPLVVAAPGMLGTDGKPRDVDREIFLMLQVWDVYATVHAYAARRSTL